MMVQCQRLKVSCLWENNYNPNKNGFIFDMITIFCIIYNLQNIKVQHIQSDNLSMSKVNQINCTPKSHRIKNLISFGNQSVDSKISDSINRSSLTVRCQDSYSFDVDRQLKGLGIEVISAEQNSLIQSLDLKKYYWIKRQKFDSFVEILTFNFNKIKQELKAIKENGLQLQQLNLVQTYLTQFKQKTASSSYVGNDEVDINNESLVISADESKYSRNKQKLLLQSTVFSLHYKKNQGIRMQSPRNRNYSKQESYLNQLKNIKQQNQLKQKQIELLKIQIIGLRKLNDSKQQHFNQKLKIKQLQWSDKLNQIIKQLTIQNKKQSSQQSQRQAQSEYSKIRKRNFTQSCQPYSCRGRINTDYNTQQSHNNTILKGSKQDLEIKIIQSPRNRTANNYNETQFKNFSGQNGSYEQKMQDRLRLSKQRQRKKSTDCSFERVTEKIKNFQSSIRRQIGKYQF